MRALNEIDRTSQRPPQRLLPPPFSRRWTIHPPQTRNLRFLDLKPQSDIAEIAADGFELLLERASCALYAGWDGLSQARHERLSVRLKCPVRGEGQCWGEGTKAYYGLINSRPSSSVRFRFIHHHLCA